MKAIILKDFPNGVHYATWVEQGKKTLETRMMLFKHEGDILICCSKTSPTANAGKALCVVHWNKGRPMTDSDVDAAKIENVPGRYVFELTNRRLLSRKFEFSRHKTSGSFQSIFDVELPEDVRIVNLSNS